MSSIINDLKSYSEEVNHILTDFLIIHDNVFNRKGSFLTKIFKPINFEDEWSIMQDIINRLDDLARQVSLTKEEPEYISILSNYIFCLRSAMLVLSHMISNLDFKAKGQKYYSKDLYNEDLGEYIRLTNIYQEHGLSLQKKYDEKFKH